MKNTITEQKIEHIFGNAKKEVQTVFGKCTIVVCELENGFILVESSACVDPQNYNLELGIDICERNIKQKLWELEGYKLQNELREEGE